MTHVAPLAKVLVRSPKSVIIRDLLEQGAVYFNRQLSFEDRRLALIALNKTHEKAHLEQIEHKLVENYKSTNSKNPTTLLNWIFNMECFRSRQQHTEV